MVTAESGKLYENGSDGRYRKLYDVSLECGDELIHLHGLIV